MDSKIIITDDDQGSSLGDSAPKLERKIFIILAIALICIAIYYIFLDKPTPYSGESETIVTSGVITTTGNMGNDIVDSNDAGFVVGYPDHTTTGSIGNGQAQSSGEKSLDKADDNVDGGFGGG